MRILSLYFKYLFFQALVTEIVGNYNNDSVNEFRLENEETNILSRRKRYLIFPEGSSLQLVFCNQVTGVIPIGDIFLFGYTAALAWQLPTDPKQLDMLREFEKASRRNGKVTKTVNYLYEDGRIIAKLPFEKRINVHPAFAKRSADDKISYKHKLKLKIDREKMQERHKRMNFMKAGHTDRDTREFHRSNRLELYRKIETLINALGRDGRQCVLYKLCETAQHRGQGTFLQEFLSVVFTLPKSQEIEGDLDKVYDAAHTLSNNCLVRFPGCITNYNM